MAPKYLRNLKSDIRLRHPTFPLYPTFKTLKVREGNVNSQTFVHLNSKKRMVSMPIGPYITLKIFLWDELKGPTESLAKNLKDCLIQDQCLGTTI